MLLVCIERAEVLTVSETALAQRRQPCQKQQHLAADVRHHLQRTLERGPERRLHVPGLGVHRWQGRDQLFDLRSALLQVDQQVLRYYGQEHVFQVGHHKHLRRAIGAGLERVEMHGGVESHEAYQRALVTR